MLDGEAVPVGGMGVCRQIKDEIFHCPPVLLLIGRPQDAWLATWSRADAAVTLPVDPVEFADALAALLRSRLAVERLRPALGAGHARSRPTLGRSRAVLGRAAARSGVPPARALPSRHLFQARFQSPKPLPNGVHRRRRRC